RRLGTIHGIKMVAVFGAWALLPQVAEVLIDDLGWRWTYVIFGLAIWALVIPLTLLFVRNRPEDIGLQLDNDADHEAPAADGAHRPVREKEVAFTLSEALRTWAYWMLAAAIALPPLVGTAFLFDLEPILARRGMDREVMVNAVSAWSIAMAALAIPIGGLTDRVRAPVLIGVGMALVAISSLMLLGATTPFRAMAAMVVYAAGQSMMISCTTAATARYFGRAHHGAIRSSLSRIAVFGTGLGPFITGLSVTLTGGYRAAMYLFVAMCVPVAVGCIWLAPPKQKEAAATGPVTADAAR
ncbi:MAG: MFS transporter, partial [Planctomycetota bacterium]|nr:MFS transporter [Planctomycetota bacterium]